MATKLDSLDLEIQHFTNIWNHLPNKQNLCYNTIQQLLELGLLQVSSVFEYCISQISGASVISLDNADLSDGSDAKIISVRTASYGTKYSAPVTGLHNKTGDLRVQCYERKQNKFYYFVIPNSFYKKIPKSSNIEIPFHLDGTPKRTNKCNINWWACEVPDFQLMSTFVTGM